MWYIWRMRKLEPVLAVYEDEFLLAVSKPARVASVPAEGVSSNRTMLGMVGEFCRARGDTYTPYLLHRIDMQTSGVLVFGKHERDREKLEGILRAKDTVKKYLTLVRGIPKGTVIKAPLKARMSDEKVFAKTLYRVMRTYRVLRTALSLMEAEIKTGRKHQIRQHFAGIRCPVVMDQVYGDQEFNKKFRTSFRLGRQFLHSALLEFTHPMSGVRVRIMAKLPIDLENVLKRLEISVS